MRREANRLLIVANLALTLEKYLPDYSHPKSPQTYIRRFDRNEINCGECSFSALQRRDEQTLCETFGLCFVRFLIAVEFGDELEPL
jgi:hypothetical protein